MGVLRILHLSLLVTFMACQTEEMLPSLDNANFPGSGGGVNPAGRWEEARFPLNLKVSNHFANEQQDVIIDRMISWEDAINNRYDFFADNVEIIDNFDPDSLDEHLKIGTNDPPEGKNMGIYYTTKYHPELVNFTIAVAYSLGYQRSDNVGPYIEMVHSDIILNGRDFTFTIDPQGADFDLESVIVHELGHLLGMKHELSNVASVMKSSIWFGQIKRDPTNRDSEVLRQNYRLDSTIANSYTAALRTGSFEEGKKVIILQKLKANGECEHYLNDTHLVSHQLID